MLSQSVQAGSCWARVAYEFLRCLHLGSGIEAAWAGGTDGRVVIDRFLPLIPVSGCVERAESEEWGWVVQW